MQRTMARPWPPFLHRLCARIPGTSGALLFSVIARAQVPRPRRVRAQLHWDAQLIYFKPASVSDTATCASSRHNASRCRLYRRFPSSPPSRSTISSWGVEPRAWRSPRGEYCSTNLPLPLPPRHPHVTQCWPIQSERGPRYPRARYRGGTVPRECARNRHPR